MKQLKVSAMVLLVVVVGAILAYNVYLGESRLRLKIDGSDGDMSFDIVDSPFYRWDGYVYLIILRGESTGDPGAYALLPIGDRDYINVKSNLTVDLSHTDDQYRRYTIVCTSEPILSAEEAEAVMHNRTVREDRIIFGDVWGGTYTLICD